MESLTGLCVDLAEAVVAHLVHEAVEQDGRALAVHSELSGGCVVVVLLDVFARVCASSDTDHPQELIDVCDADRNGVKYAMQHIKSHVKTTPAYTRLW